MNEFKNVNTDGYIVNAKENTVIPIKCNIDNNLIEFTIKFEKDGILINSIDKEINIIPMYKNTIKINIK